MLPCSSAIYIWHDKEPGLSCVVGVPVSCTIGHKWKLLGSVCLYSEWKCLSAPLNKRTPQKQQLDAITNVVSETAREIIIS